MVLSALVMAGLFVHHRMAEEKGIVTKLHAMRAKTDPIIKDTHNRLKHALSFFTPHHIAIFSHNLFVHAGRFFMHVTRKAHYTSAKLVEKAAQRKEDLSKAVAPSFYMKQVTDAKEASTGAVEETVDSV